MIVLIDRDVDMVTPLCTQLTYEGLIDEIIGVQNGSVEVPNDEGKKAWPYTHAFILFI